MEKMFKFLLLIQFLAATINVMIKNYDAAIYFLLSIFASDILHKHRPKKKKESVKYELTYIYPHANFVDERIKQYQDEGWEICGDIKLQSRNGDVTTISYLIPLKRKL